MSPRMGRTGGAAARGFGKGTAVRGPRGIPSVVSATAVGTVNDASNGRLNLVWTNTDVTAQTRIYNGGTLLATENAGTTTKSLTTLNANTAYTLTVKHYKDSIESAGANFSQATTYVHSGANNSYYCSGCTYRQTYANGNNGTTDNAVADYYQDCGSGYSCCRPNGQLVSTACVDTYNDGTATDYVQTYSNGSCGTYSTTEYNDCTNCYCPGNDCSAGPGSAGSGGGCSNNGWWDDILGMGDCCSGTAWESGPSYCCNPANYGGSYVGCYQNCGNPSTICGSWPAPYSC